MAKLNPLETYDTISIRTNKGNKAAGTPLGTNKFKKVHFCFKNPNIVKPTTEEKPNIKVKIMWLVKVNEEGINPIKFESNIKKNKVAQYMKYSEPLLPVCETTTFNKNL